MQQGRFRRNGMMVHHPRAIPISPVVILITEPVVHFCQADLVQSSKAPKEYDAIGRKETLECGIGHRLNVSCDDP